MSNSPTILAPASVQAENAHHAEVEPLNGNGFYRFKIGDFQATVISDGYGPIPAPIFAVNAAEAELAAALRANFMQPVIQVTGNPLVVDRDGSVSLSTPALARNSAHPSATFLRSRRTCAGQESRRRASIWSRFRMVTWTISAAW
jgi:hypothetical protein